MHGIGGVCVVLAALPTTLAGSAQAASVRQLVEAANLSGLALSPDGRSIALRVDRAEVAANRYHLQWMRIDLTTGVAHDGGTGGQAIYRDPGMVDPGRAVWSPDGSRFYYRALAEGAIGIWQSRTPSTPAHRLLVKPANVSSIAAGTDGKIIYSLGPDRDDVLGAEAREYREGVRIDHRTDLAQPLFGGGWIDGRLAAQRLAGHWFSRVGLLSGSPERRFMFDPVTKGDQALQPSPLDPPDLSPNPSPQAVSAEKLIASAANDGGRATITVTGLPLARHWQSDAAGDRVIWQAWRPGTRQLMFAVRDIQLRDRLFRWDMASGRVRLLVRREGVLAGDSQEANQPCALTRRSAICIAADPLGPPQLVRIDLSSGRLTTLFDPNRSLRHGLMARTRRLSWTGDGTGTVSGILLRPARGRRHPLFISYYRCLGWLKGGEGGEWPFAALIDAGFAVACLTAPRETGAQDATKSYRTAQQAILALVGDMAKRGEIDPHRIGMGGLSFGSEVTLWMLTHTSLLHAASIASGQIEPAYYWFNAGRGRNQPDTLFKVWGLGPPGTTTQRWSDLSPAQRSGMITAPLLLQLPEQEARVNPEFHARLSRLAVPSEVYVFPDEPHVKVQPAHQWQVMERNLDWFRFWLNGEEGPDQFKRDQYRRWRSLKDQKPEPLPVP